MLITNGAAHSMMEAAIFGVPVLAIPLAAPEYSNARKLEQRGLGLILDKANVTTENVHEKLTKLMQDPK